LRTKKIANALVLKGFHKMTPYWYVIRQLADEISLSAK
jgi:hypothetical protein